MAGKSKKPRKNVESPERKKNETHEIFTAKRLIIMFLILEILIIALMYPTFRGRWHMNKAKQAADDKNYEKAYKHYKWLGENTPAAESASYQLELGNVCMALERYDEAILHYKKLIEKTEGQDGSHTLLGKAYLKNGRINLAREQFSKELDNNPTNPQANFHLGDLAYKNGNYAEATAYFSRVAYLPEYKKRLQRYWDKIEKNVLEK